MSTEVSRRNFLKTGAAAAILSSMSVILTGCGSDSDSKNPSFKDYKSGTFCTLEKDGVSLYVVCQGIYVGTDYHILQLSISPSDDVTIYTGNFAAYVNSPLVCVTLQRDDTAEKFSSITLKKGSPVKINAWFERVPGNPTFKFSYGNQSVKFKKPASDSPIFNILYTDVYTDTF